MKIVHVEDRFEPDAGYQINEMIKQHSKRENEIVVITSDQPIFSKPEELYKKDKELIKKYPSVQIIRLKPLFVISNRYYFKSLQKKIDNLSPDILFLHGIVDFKDLFLFTRKRKYPVYRDCHMSLSGSKNLFNRQIINFYRFFFSKRASKKYESVYFLGEEEKEYINELGLEESIIKPMLHGYDRDNIRFDNKQRLIIRQKYKIKNDDICILYTGKLDWDKQPHLIFNMLNNFNNINENKIKIIFVGNINKNYLEYFNKELESFNNRSTIDVIIVDAQPYEKLYKYYSCSDICIFPKQCTLSSIHAQVCNNIVIMQKEKSNIERVYFKENLFSKNDINEASEILIQKLIDEEYKISKRELKNMLNWLSKREYDLQIKEVEKIWELQVNG